MYRFYNANSKGRFVNDCVVRAISVAENENWDKCYKELSELAQQEGTILDDMNFVDNYLNDRYNKIDHMSKYVGDLCEEYPTGTYLITMQGHITVLKNGVIYDIFDCRNNKIKEVWKIN